MRNWVIWTTAILMFVGSVGLYNVQPVAATAPPSANDGVKSVVQGNSDFAMDLYKKIASSADKENIFFSPFSISSALSMTYAGAGGNTAGQMATVLHFNLEPSLQHAAFGSLNGLLKSEGKPYRLEIANVLWGQQNYPFRSEYLELVRKHYEGGFRTVDFANQSEASRELINQWVAQKTADKIKDLIPPRALTPLTRLVLTNAIYFKGDWAVRFKPEMTKEMPFFVGPAQSVPVPMMRQTSRFKFAETDEAKVLELPYVGNELSMVLVLPKAEIAAWEKTLTAVQVNEWLVRASEQEVEVFLPRFKFETRYELKDLLAGMGMTDAFELPPADFSGISGNLDLYITRVIHKAVIEVNEQGSEAAAATAVIVGTKAVMHKPVFKADQPFLFMIRHNETGSILFLGAVKNPTGK